MLRNDLYEATVSETLKSIYISFLHFLGNGRHADWQLRKGVVQLRDAEEGQIRAEDIRCQGQRKGRTLDEQASLG